MFFATLHKTRWISYIFNNWRVVLRFVTLLLLVLLFGSMDGEMVGVTSSPKPSIQSETGYTQQKVITKLWLKLCPPC